MTRKKVIDFAKIGEKLSLTGSSCHYCKSIMTVLFSNACRSILNIFKKTLKRHHRRKRLVIRNTAMTVYRSILILSLLIALTNFGNVLVVRINAPVINARKTG